MDVAFLDSLVNSEGLQVQSKKLETLKRRAAQELRSISDETSTEKLREELNLKTINRSPTISKAAEISTESGPLQTKGNKTSVTAAARLLVGGHHKVHDQITATVQNNDLMNTTNNRVNFRDGVHIADRLPSNDGSATTQQNDRGEDSRDVLSGPFFPSQV
jgi:hypothetical protein